MYSFHLKERMVQSYRDLLEQHLTGTGARELLVLTGGSGDYGHDSDSDGGGDGYTCRSGDSSIDALDQSQDNECGEDKAEEMKKEEEEVGEEVEEEEVEEVEEVNEDD